MEKQTMIEAQQTKIFSTGKEWFFLAALFVWGYLFILWPPMPYLGIRVTLYVFSAAAIGYSYLRAGKKTPAKASWFFLGVLFLLSLSFSLFENSGIGPMLFLLLFFLYAGWLFNAVQPGKLDGRQVTGSLSLLLARPFTRLTAKTSVFQFKSHSRTQTKSILLGLLVTLPVLAIAAMLLTAADQNFDFLVGHIIGNLLDEMGDILVRVFLACVIAGFLISMFLSAVNLEEKGAPKPPAQANATVMSMLIGALCLLYMTFVTVQVMSVADVLSKQSLGASFYSMYARDGFFELCAVTILNFIVFLVAHIFRRNATKSMRILLTALGGFTQALIVIAIVKMAMYMNHYGLTLLRVQTIWFMISLFLTFAVLIALQWKTFGGFKCVAILAAVSILAASYANIGGLVAGVNVNRYLSGSLSHLDIDQYEWFPYEAAPHLIRGYSQIEDPDMKDRVGSFLKSVHDREDAGVLNASVQQMLAKVELAVFCEKHIPDSLRPTEGQRETGTESR